MDRNAASSIFSISQQTQIRNNISEIFKWNLREIFSSAKVRDNLSPNFTNSIEANAFYTISIPTNLKDDYKRGDVHWVVSKKSGQPTGQLADREGKFRGFGVLKKAVQQNGDSAMEAVAAGVEAIKKINDNPAMVAVAAGIEFIAEQNNNAAAKLAAISEDIGIIKTQNKTIINQLNQIKLQNAAIMQQLMQITEIVSDIRSRVIALQKLHDTDLTGGIIGVRDLLLQIKDPNDLSFQKSVLASAVNDLNRDRGRIQQELIGLLEEMPEMPRTGFGRAWKIARDDQFCTDVSEKHHRVQWLFSLYLTATMLLGYAYAIVGEGRAYGRVFMPDAELMDNANLIKLVRAEKMFVTVPEDAWYKNTDEYLGRLGREAQRLFADDSACQLQLTGSELQEVLSLETAEC